MKLCNKLVVFSAFVFSFVGSLRPAFSQYQYPWIQLGTSGTPANNFYYSPNLGTSPATLELWNGNYGAPVGPTPLLAITGTGSVGMGTPSPGRRLDVHGSDPDLRIRLHNSSPASTTNVSSLDLTANTTYGLRTAGIVRARFTETADTMRKGQMTLQGNRI